MLIDKIFALPPTEKRVMWLAHTPLRKFFVEPSFRSDMDDTYIYYLCGQWSLIISFVLAMFNLASQQFNVTFNFWLFAIHLPHSEFLGPFLTTFTKYTAPVMFVLVIPFYLICYLRHIDIKNFDVAWWSGKPMVAKTNSKLVILGCGCLFLAITYAAMWGSFSFGWLWLNNAVWDMGNSMFFFVLWICILPVLIALISRVVLMGLVGIVHNLCRIDFVRPTSNNHKH